MANPTRTATWKIYQDAWADISPAEREELLDRSVAAEVTFESMTGEGKGLAEITMNIENFQKQFPGATFTTHKYYEHHDQLLAEWVMYDKSGNEVLPGRSYARFDAGQKLIQLSGFWDV